MDLFDIAVASKLAGGGGGGGGGLDLLAEVNLGTIETSSTSFIDTGKTVALGDVRDYDALLFVISTDKRENGYHIATIRGAWLSGAFGAATGATTCTPVTTVLKKSNGQIYRASPSSVCGVFANNFVGDIDNLAVTIYKKYDASNTMTINAEYTVKVFGIKLREYIGV